MSMSELLVQPDMSISHVLVQDHISMPEVLVPPDMSMSQVLVQQLALRLRYRRQLEAAVEEKRAGLARYQAA